MISQRTCMKMYYSLPTCTCHTFCVYNITRLLRYGTLGVYEENLASPLRDTTPLKAVSSSCTGEKISDSCMHNAAFIVLERLRGAASNEQQFAGCSC